MKQQSKLEKIRIQSFVTVLTGNLQGGHVTEPLSHHIICMST